MNKERVYTEDSIKTLDILTAIREKTNLYTGSKDNDSIIHTLVEVLNNSLDEFLAGYGNEIEVNLNTQTNTISVRDYGRGIPFNSIPSIFLELHSSGKFTKEEDTAYQSSAGTFGIGLLTVTALSKEVKVSSFRENKICNFTFNQADYTGGGVTEGFERSGTLIAWTPDSTLPIEDTIFHPNKVRRIIQNLSYAVPNCILNLTVDGEQETFHSKSIEKFLFDNISKEDMISDVFSFNLEKDGLCVDMALVWAKGGAFESSFVNLAHTSGGGNHVSTFRAALTRSVNKILGSSLKGDSVRKNLSYIMSLKVNKDAIFASQHKSVLAMPEINAPFSQLISSKLEEVAQSSKKMFVELMKEEERERRREQANLQVRELLVKSKTVGVSSDKLKPALQTKDAELFITEGNSASGSLISTRNPHTHAIMSLRGKIINFKKNDMEKVLQNKEIQDIILTMGGWGKNYDGSQSPYSKIVIATDADEDGAHIRLLLISFFFEFYPKIIEQGKLYFLESPLYIIRTAKGSEYIFTEGEMKRKLELGLPKNATYSRNKGLGELPPKILGEIAFGETRRLKQFKIKNREEVKKKLENYLGQNSSERRKLMTT